MKFSPKVVFAFLFVGAFISVQAQTLGEFLLKDDGFKASKIGDGPKKIYISSLNSKFEMYKEAVDKKAAVGSSALDKDVLQAKADQLYSEAYNNIAAIYAYEDSLQLSLKHLKYSLKIEEELNDVKGIAESVNNVGVVYYYFEKFDSALVFFEKSRKLDYSQKNYAGPASTHNNIGDVHL